MCSSMKWIEGLNEVEQNNTLDQYLLDSSPTAYILGIILINYLLILAIACQLLLSNRKTKLFWLKNLWTFLPVYFYFWPRSYSRVRGHSSASVVEVYKALSSARKSVATGKLSFRLSPARRRPWSALFCRSRPLAPRNSCTLHSKALKRSAL